VLLCDYYSIQLKKPIRYEKKCYSDMRSKAYMSQISAGTNYGHMSVSVCHKSMF